MRADSISCRRAGRIQPRENLCRHFAFTLIELLVVIAIIAVLAAILFPVFAQAREKARQAVCMSNLKQIGTALFMYQEDYDEFLPDRRDLKLSLPGGYRPWVGWPPSDPRAGWAAIILEPYTKNNAIWSCPSVTGSQLGLLPEVVQSLQDSPTAPVTRYWMWRFDQPTPQLDNLWGKTDQQAVSDLQQAKNPQVGYPNGPADVEMVVDPYFPNTIKSVPASLRGKSVHFGGRNRMFLDTHVRYLRDGRLK